MSVVAFRVIKEVAGQALDEVFVLVLLPLPGAFTRVLSRVHVPLFHCSAPHEMRFALASFSSPFHLGPHCHGGRLWQAVQTPSHVVWLNPCAPLGHRRARTFQTSAIFSLAWVGAIVLTAISRFLTWSTNIRYACALFRGRQGRQLSGRAPLLSKKACSLRSVAPWPFQTATCASRTSRRRLQLLSSSSFL